MNTHVTVIYYIILNHKSQIISVYVDVLYHDEIQYSHMDIVYDVQ